MEYKIRDDSGVTIIELSGEVDVAQAAKLRGILLELLDSNSGGLLVNMHDVIYIDSAGLSVLIGAHRKAQNVGGVFGLSNLQQPVHHVFKLTRMTKVFRIFPSVKQGVGALKNNNDSI